MRLLAALASIAVLAAPLSLRAEPVPAAVSIDPPRDKAHPARMATLQIRSRGQAMNAVFYLASGIGPHPTVILFHGSPGNEQNLDLAQAIRRDGRNVLTLHYRGAWGSAGRYSISNAIEDSEAALAFVRDPQNVERYGLTPGKVAVIGHSLGGFLAARLGAKEPDLLGVGMIAAWNVGPDGPRMQALTPAQYEDEFGDLAGRVVGADGRSLTAEAMAHQKDWSWDAYAPGLAKLPTLVVAAHDDGYADNIKLAQTLKSAGAQASLADIDTDHPFSDSRIALEAAVLRWLENLPGAPAGP